jgi:hypothetical protein
MDPIVMPACEAVWVKERRAAAPAPVSTSMMRSAAAAPERRLGLRLQPTIQQCHYGQGHADYDSNFQHNLAYPL